MMPFSPCKNQPHQKWHIQSAAQSPPGYREENFNFDASNDNSHPARQNCSLGRLKKRRVRLFSITLFVVLVLVVGMFAEMPSIAKLSKAGQKLAACLDLHTPGTNSDSNEGEKEEEMEAQPAFFYECFSPIVDFPAMQGILVPQN